MKCALVMTGGIAKGAFQAGVIKSFAERDLKPTVVVGASAGAMNSGMVTKLIAEGNFTPEAVEECIIKGWYRESKLSHLWGRGDITKKDSIRNIFADVHTNPFMLIKRLANLQMDVWDRLKVLFSLSFISVFNDEPIAETMERNVSTPSRIVEDIICSVSVTDLFAHSEYISGQSINNYGEYVTFRFEKGKSENLESDFKLLRKVIQASACLPGMFPPVQLDINGKGKKPYIDGGITKNAPFGRAIKLDPEIEYIFLVSTAPITKPIINTVDNFPAVVGQVYEIVVTKDIANDYRKVIQINEKIKLLAEILEKGKKGQVLDNKRNNDMCKLAGFNSVEEYLTKRCVEIIFIEPEQSLIGDPFSAIYRKDRKFILDTYIAEGYKTGKKSLDAFFEKKSLLEQEALNLTA